MAAFFTGVVGAPVTGIVLVVFVAMLLPMLPGNAPIYDSPREQTLRLERQIRQR
jgi:CIC family chloride channel protein